MYADVIIDIISSEVDRPFSYRIPEKLISVIFPGQCVLVPFGKGSALRKGYVISLKEKCDYPDSKIKEIDSVSAKASDIDEQLLKLAIRMREMYGGTLYSCLSVVLPGKEIVKRRIKYLLKLNVSQEKLEELISEAEKKKYIARERLLKAFRNTEIIPLSILYEKLQLSAQSVNPLVDAGIFTLIETGGRSTEAEYLKNEGEKHWKINVLNEEQETAVNGILKDDRTVHLLFGVTGSGKTEVYLKLIEETLLQGKEAIVLIPEIALTYQTVMRFYMRFGDIVSLVHSKLSKGEKYERFFEAREKKIRIMIGPRSALFTPFTNLGIIIIDEFHENSYISEQVPKYNTIDMAIERAKLQGAKVVLGSATPTVECYYKAEKNEYGLYVLTKRAGKESRLPDISIVDMRLELKNRNKSVFSNLLKEKIQDRLDKNEQIMLFLNRRGYSGAVSCRACGEPLICPHCSVSLNYHNDNTLHCHLCGYSKNMVSECPKCGSNLIGTFGIGTQKVEELLQKTFPGVRTLRMDADTTKEKDSLKSILTRFMNHEADILVGTQMIVKGHDFKNVTLVGILAADLSLNVPDYKSAERTYQLLVQAEGRAGRGEITGECIIQTYMPSHFAIRAASQNDYLSFYNEEIAFRKKMIYPPFGIFMSITVSGKNYEEVKNAATYLAGSLRMKKRRFLRSEETKITDPEMRTSVKLLGPTDALILKIKDMYRQVFYLKCPDEESFYSMKDQIEENSAKFDSKKIYVSIEI